MQHDLMVDLVQDHQRELLRLAGRSARQSGVGADTPVTFVKDHQRELLGVAGRLRQMAEKPALQARPRQVGLLARLLGTR
jgi:hypothetical protein